MVSRPPGPKALPPPVGQAALERRLRQFLADSPSAFLPSLRELARTFRVGRKQLTVLAGKLVAEGLLIPVGPRRLAVADRLPEPRARLGVESVCASLRQGMAEGRYRAGQPFPKLAGLAVELGVSQPSMSRALMRLEREGHAHRRGRIWHAGAAPPPAQATAVRALKTLVLCMRKPHTWSSINASPRDRGFCIQFSHEAQLRRYRLLPFSLEEPGNPRPDAAARLRALRRELGEKWAGVLMLGRRADFPDLPIWLRFFARLGLPVAWFDDIDQGLPDLPRRELADLARAPGFTRCHWREEPGLLIALRHLAEAGHARVGYLLTDHRPWNTGRRDRIAALARTHFPGLEILALPPPPPAEPLPSAEALLRRWRGALADKRSLAALWLRRLLPRTGRAGAAGLEELERELRRPPGKKVFIGDDGFVSLYFAELMDPYLAAGATALLAPNDFLAAYLHRSLAGIGARVPEDLSLLSFDNYTPQGQLHPVSTVDFGLGHLGYCAFHALIGDIPLGRDRFGDLPSQPILVDKGSVGPPARRGGAGGSAPARISGRLP